MIPYPVALAVAAHPVAQATTEPLVSEGNVIASLTQLGIGGVLVAFGTTIYARFEKRADRAAEAHRAEVQAVTDRLTAEIQAERLAHEATRRDLMQAIARNNE